MLSDHKCPTLYIVQYIFEYYYPKVHNVVVHISTVRANKKCTWRNTGPGHWLGFVLQCKQSTSGLPYLLQHQMSHLNKACKPETTRDFCCEDVWETTVSKLHNELHQTWWKGFPAVLKAVTRVDTCNITASYLNKEWWAATAHSHTHSLIKTKTNSPW